MVAGRCPQHHRSGRGEYDPVGNLRVISRKPASPLVSREDVEWVWAVVFRSVQLIRTGARLHMSGSPAEALRKAIIAAIEESDGGLFYSKLLERKGVRNSDGRQLSDALQWLMDTDQIVDANGRPKLGKGSKLVLTA
ncbi:MAG TPA: hypothetical protein VN541_21060 [Tepidisphaeraceae bacterium]|nr:hypothetical protein [Tepidisphaeraceae bacterium]